MPFIFADNSESTLLMSFYVRRSIRSLFVFVYEYLRRHTQLIEPFGGESDFVVPIDGEGVEAEGTEIVQVLQLAADTLLHQRCEVNQQHLSRAECQAQHVVASVLGGGHFEQ